MPRPKRTKVAPSVPAPRVRPTAATASATVSSPKASLDDISDQENRVVRSVRSIQRNNVKEKHPQSQGRAGAKDAPTPLPAGSKALGGSNMLESNDAPSSASSELENALDDIEHGSNSPDIEVGRRVHSTPMMERSSLGFGNFRRRARQPSILGRRAGRARSSSVDSNLADDNGLMSVGQSDTSALAGNFKRRPRQGSILGRNASALPHSSMGLEMGTPAQVRSALKLGNFKRRARAPSILGTAQKARQQRPGHNDEQAEEEDDFNPDDESTPLNLAKNRNVSSSSAVISSSNSRKRKLSAAQVPSSPIRHSPDADEDEEVEERNSASGSVVDAEEDDEEPSMPSVEVVSRSVTPEPMSETMAPPQASSSIASSPEPELPLPPRRSVSRGRRPLRGRTPPPATLDSPISSPPSLTHSPNRPYMTGRNKPKREAPPPSAFSTAQLQALLPRRRRQPTRDPFDIASSEDEAEETALASDEDELSHINNRGRNRRSIFARTPAPTKRGSKAKPALKAGTKQTYGSRVNPIASDKENEEVDPDDSLAPLPDDDGGSPEDSQKMEERLGKELKKVARKFEEVDKWELEFEEDTGSSSPLNAR